MLFIVSPAKKMNVVDDSLPWHDLPRFVDRAEELARTVRALGYSEAKALWACSDALAELNFERFRTLADELRGPAGLTPAVLSYEGIQYQHLAPQVMTERELLYLDRHLRILSGFYGVLRPFDGVRPYRLEMQAKLQAGHAKNLYAYWGDALAKALVEECAGVKAAAPVIVNLASVEYAKAVLPHVAPDPAIPETSAAPEAPNLAPEAPSAPVAPAPAAPNPAPASRVLTCLFGSIDARGRFVQRSTAAKAARGSFVRWCAEHAVEDPREFPSFDLLNYHYDPSRSTADTLVFVRDAPSGSARR